MPAPSDQPAEDDRQLLLIVVGAHLRAEEADRPLAYQLVGRIKAWLRQHRESLNVQITPLVCTDLWYLNHTDLQRRPTVCLGGPGVNALSAYFAQQLDPPEPDEQQIVVQFDPDFTDLRVCVWGTNRELTQRGLDLFVDRYLDGFLRGTATQVEPREE